MVVMSKGPIIPDGGRPAPLFADARRSPLKPAPWVASLCLHLATATLLATIDGGKLSPAADVEQIEDVLARGDHKIVWHIFTEKLPPVAPQEGNEQESAKGSRAEFEAPQAIVASDPDPRSDRQMIWTADPAPEIEYDVPSPNLLVWTPPELPRLRFAMEQRRQQERENEAIQADPAPEIETAANTSVDLAAIRPMARLRYWAEERKLTEPEKQALASGLAPQVSGTAAPGFNLEQIQRLDPLRFRMETPVARGPATQAISSDRAPALADPLPLGDEGAWGAAMATAQANASLGSVQPVSRASGTGEGSGGGSVPNSGGAADAAPEEADIAGRKLAVVGVNPTKDTQGPLPFGRRRGRFSAAPDGGSGGSGMTGGPGGSASVNIPNLSISGAEGATGASVAAFAARTDSGASLGSWRFNRDTFQAGIGDHSLTGSPFDVPPEPTPENPEAGFAGRRTRTLSINMPNINSAQGSWIVRFSEVAGPERKGELLAPVPYVKVDPKYARSAIEEGVEGEVILSGVIRSDGVVDQVTLIRSLDQRLDEAAISALSKWKFHPAWKAGVPVDVDVVVRIPFRLTPLG